jgi:putative aminopeptidase FrvX
MVEYVDDNGYLYVQPIGGWDMQILLGQNLTVWTKSGPLAGVISRRAPHLLTNEERNKVPQFADVWIDIGAKDRKDAEDLVTPGDPVTFALGYRPLRNGLASSPAMDDKVGLWAVMEALRLLHGQALQSTVYCVSTVQEEIGLRGAHTSSEIVKPEVGIALEAGVTKDAPKTGPEEAQEVLGGGPAIFLYDSSELPNRKFAQLVKETAKAAGIPLQTDVIQGYGDDSAEMQKAGGGAPTVNLVVPIRFTHSHNGLMNRRDFDQLVDLLVAVIQKLDAKTVANLRDFTP